MKYLVATILCLFVSFAQAAELTLFDIPLHSSSRATIRQAIKQAGGKLTSTTNDIDRYDASAMRLPGAARLEVVYLKGDFVLAQYVFPTLGPNDERLRKMLAIKYGSPREGSGFEHEFIMEGKFRWSFEHDMELVYAKAFAGEALLTYVNRVQKSKLEKVVNGKDIDDVKKKARELGNVF
jgi:hypothetical protein